MSSAGCVALCAKRPTCEAVSRENDVGDCSMAVASGLVGVEAEDAAAKWVYVQLLLESLAGNTYIIPPVRNSHLIK